MRKLLSQEIDHVVGGCFLCFTTSSETGDAPTSEGIFVRIKKNISKAFTRATDWAFSPFSPNVHHDDQGSTHIVIIKNEEMATGK